MLSGRAELMIKFCDYTTSSSFEEAVNALPYWGQTTRIDLGLEVAMEEMFQEINGMRPHKLQNLVLLTDGRQTGVRYDSWRVKFNSEGIRVVVIGVGSVDQDSLRHFVLDDSDFHVAEDFTQLLSDSFMKSIALCAPCK